MTAILLCSVGLIVNVIATAGIGNTFSLMINEWAGHSLLIAVALIALASLVLGMGLPSAVCYLLMAILVGGVLTKLDTPPLAAHLFIFYFGMMSMITPPIALAAFAAASIAKAPSMPTGRGRRRACCTPTTDPR